MNHRLIDRPVSTTESVSTCMTAVAAFGSVLGLIIAGMPFVGGVLGGVVGALIGWSLRNVTKKRGSAAPRQQTL
jgi:hypothetical protein